MSVPSEAVTDEWENRTCINRLVLNKNVRPTVRTELEEGSGEVLLSERRLPDP